MQKILDLQRKQEEQILDIFRDLGQPKREINLLDTGFEVVKDESEPVFGQVYIFGDVRQRIVKLIQNNQNECLEAVINQDLSSGRGVKDRSGNDDNKNPYSNFQTINQISESLGVTFGQEINEEELNQFKRPKRILIKTIKRLFNSDIENSAILYARLLKKGIINVFQLLQCKYAQNQEYQIYEIREQLLEDLLNSEKMFFTRFDTKTDSGLNSTCFLEKYLSEFIIEVFCFAEDFKEAWINFFKDKFLDHVDRGEFDINVFNQLVLKNLKRGGNYLPKYSKLKEILLSATSARCWASVESFCKLVGGIIFNYNKTIRLSTRKKLQSLNYNLNNSKFLTSHIVVCSVYRLRYELRDMNEKNFQKIKFLWNMDREKLRSFWKDGVVNFDKDYELGNIDQPGGVKKFVSLSLRIQRFKNGLIY